MTRAVRSFAAHRLPLAVCAAAWLAAVLLAAVGVWILVGLAVAAGTYLLGRVDERRASAAEVDRLVRERTHALGFQLARLEQATADRDEMDHAAVRDPRQWANPRYAPRGVFDSPTRPGVGLPQQGASVE